MPQTNINIRVDEQLKQQFSSICEQLGMNASTALNIYMKAVVRNRGIPFSVELEEEPNSATKQAIDDVNHGRNLSKTFHTVKDLMEDLNA